MRTAIKREVPELQYFRAVEVQDGRHLAAAGRGALHLHVMVWTPVPLDVQELRRRAVAAGFGHEVDLAPMEPGSRRAAYYVSKYVVKACDSRGGVPWDRELLDVTTGELTLAATPATYRTWSSSRGWGLTMAAIKSDCAVYARARAEAMIESQEVAALGLLARELGASVVGSDGIPPPAPT